MEKFEEDALRSANLKPRLWHRYVNDTFVLWIHHTDQVEQFHKHQIKQHQQIQFTSEEENNHKISFPGQFSNERKGEIHNSGTCTIFPKVLTQGYYFYNHVRTWVTIWAWVIIQARVIIVSTPLRREFTGPYLQVLDNTVQVEFQ